MFLYGGIGLVIGIIGTLVVMNNRNAISKKALAEEQAVTADLKAKLAAAVKAV